MKLSVGSLNIPNYKGGYMVSRSDISIVSNMNNAVEMAQGYRPGFDSVVDGAYGCFCNFAYGTEPYSQDSLGNTPIDEIDATCKHLKDCLQCARAEFGTSCTTEQTLFQHDSGFCLDQAGTCERAICECHAQFGAANSQAHLNLGGHDETALWGDMTDGSFLHFRANVCPQLCPAGKISLTTDSASNLILEANGLFQEQRLFADSSRQIFFENNKWVILENNLVVAQSQDSPSCPDGVSDWFSESGTLLSNVSVSKPGSGSTGGEVKCCFNPTGPFHIYNDSKKACCSDGTVKSIGSC
ncbi:unnamed protein product [Oikopleura dioica]|uniref:Phospholipase A2 domain-containing protein n=1 Tax=Oikopleura dioica TaxID=34765 RepID=E4X4X5_OIKDI|nr:unnamed protein product [Oikopleura dioica]